MRQSQQRSHFQTMTCRLVGSSPADGSEPFFASPAGALRPSGPSWRKGPPTCVVGTSARPIDALHCRRRISCYPARCRAASPRFSKDHPSIDIPAGVHSQHPWPLDPSRERGGRAPRSLRHRAPQPFARSVLVVLHHRDGLLHQWLAGLLHPATDHGVHRVSARPCLPTSARFPTDAMPSRACPLTKPHPRHRRPLPSCRSRSASPLGGTWRLQGLAPCKHPQRGDSVAGGPHP